MPTNGMPQTIQAPLGLFVSMLTPARPTTRKPAATANAVNEALHPAVARRARIAQMHAHDEHEKDGIERIG